MHGTDLHALAAAVAQLLVDHVHALGVLGDSALLTGSGAFSALDTGVGLGLPVFSLHNLNAGFIRVKLFVKIRNASAFSLQAYPRLTDGFIITFRKVTVNEGISIFLFSFPYK